MSSVDQAAHVAIFRNHKTEILLTLRSDMPLWVLPGGHKEDQESIDQTAVREVLEETGLEIKDVELVAIYSDSDKKVQKYLYTTSSYHGTEKLSPETADIKWFSITDLPFNLLNYEIKRISLSKSESPAPIELPLTIQYKEELRKFSKKPLFLLNLIVFYLKSKISSN